MTTATLPAAAALALGAPAFLLRRAAARLGQMAELRRQRLALSHRQDAAGLADLGLTAEALRAEIDRPFWDAPAHWLLPPRQL